ncbi:MAG: S-methyl-5'-thioadenosine phosphorylase [Candidatus Binatia bacterium]
MPSGKGVVGVIGGSGLYQIAGLKRVREIRLNTPFGRPSAAYVRGTLDGTELVFLPRHGKGHRWLPTELNFRANIFGMKKLGVERIISVSAVGSLRKGIAPGHVVVPDQFIDRTTQRHSTFFGNGIVAHVSLADPLCLVLSKALIRGGEDVGAKIHTGGTYLCMEGPQFSTRAESNLYRSWGADVIGMTNLQEAKLAREAEICFATLALATDYDCWNQKASDVKIAEVLAILKANVLRAQQIIRKALGHLPPARSCDCTIALKDAIVTDKRMIPKTICKHLNLIIGKYL